MQLSILTQFLCQTLDSVPNREISQIKRSIHRFSMSHHPIFRSLCRLPSQNGRADGCRRHREAQPDRSDSRTADREIRAEGASSQAPRHALPRHTAPFHSDTTRVSIRPNSLMKRHSEGLLPRRNPSPHPSLRRITSHAGYCRRLAASQAACRASASRKPSVPESNPTESLLTGIRHRSSQPPSRSSCRR